VRFNPFFPINTWVIWGKWVQFLRDVYLLIAATDLLAIWEKDKAGWTYWPSNQEREKKSWIWYIVVTEKEINNKQRTGKDWKKMRETRNQPIRIRPTQSCVHGCRRRRQRDILGLEGSALMRGGGRNGYFVGVNNPKVISNLRHFHSIWEIFM
jgi:hypothetical protein